MTQRHTTKAEVNEHSLCLLHPGSCGTLKGLSLATLRCLPFDLCRCPLGTNKVHFGNESNEHEAAQSLLIPSWQIYFNKVI